MTAPLAPEMAVLWVRIDELVARVEAGALDVADMTRDDAAEFVRAANQFVDDMMALVRRGVKRPRTFVSIRDVPSE